MRSILLVLSLAMLSLPYASGRTTLSSEPELSPRRLSARRLQEAFDPPPQTSLPPLTPLPPRASNATVTTATFPGNGSAMGDTPAATLHAVSSPSSYTAGNSSSPTNATGTRAATLSSWLPTPSADDHADVATHGALSADTTTTAAPPTAAPPPTPGQAGQRPTAAASRLTLLLLACLAVHLVGHLTSEAV